VNKLGITFFHIFLVTTICGVTLASEGRHVGFPLSVESRRNGDSERHFNLPLSPLFPRGQHLSKAFRLSGFFFLAVISKKNGPDTDNAGAILFRVPFKPALETPDWRCSGAHCVTRYHQNISTLRRQWGFYPLRKVSYMSGTTGQTCTVSGIYRSSGTCGHAVERAIPLGHTFPPCEHCHRAITWILVRATQTR
jgi:hypothetical protein